MTVTGAPTPCPLCGQPVSRGFTTEELREQVRHDIRVGGLSEAALAARVGGMSRRTIARILNGQRVSPAMWLRLDRYYLASTPPPVRLQLRLAPGERLQLRRLPLRP